MNSKNQKHFFVENFSGEEYNENLEELKELEKQKEKRKKIIFWIIFIMIMMGIGYLVFLGGFF